MRIATRDLPTLLQSAPDGVAILSLDCFDTLLWPNMDLPADLMADAKRRGMQVIIVADTHLEASRLRARIAAAAGPDVETMIDRVYCSCDYGVSKAGGLFTHVLVDLGVSPSAILHVGANPTADQLAPARLGIHSVHLEQFEAEREQRLPQDAIMASRHFGPGLRKADVKVGAIPLPVMLMDASGDHVVIDIDAVPTVEGYYQALIPIGAAHYSTGIQIGCLADWVQVEEASFHLAENFSEVSEKDAGRAASMDFEAMEEVAPGLHRCEGDASFILIPPPSVAKSGEMMLLSFVFRPVIRRGIIGQKEAARAA